MDFWSNILVSGIGGAFGSIIGSAAGVYLTYRYLRRTVGDAVVEYRGILLSDDMRQKLIDAMNKTPSPILRFILHSGDEYLIDKITYVGDHCFTASYTHVDQEGTSAKSWGIGTFRFTALAFLQEKDQAKD